MLSGSSFLKSTLASLKNDILIFLGGFSLFSYGLGNIPSLYFDEIYYIPAAKTWLTGGIEFNFEHPPLAKMLMAVGISLFGDTPIGWRIASCVFGAVALVAVYRIALYFFKSPRSAWVCTAITLANSFLFVQSRIAMLDVFMMAFFLWGVFFFLKSEEQIRYSLGLSGLFFGLALASKEFAILPIMSFVGLRVLYSKFLQKRTDERILKSYGVLALGILVVYLLTFIPFLFLPLFKEAPIHGTILKLQSAIWKTQWLEHRAKYSHAYASEWWEWILSIRPMWYVYGRLKIDPLYSRGVLILGNPLVMWGGLLSVIYCVGTYFKKKTVLPLGLVVFYCSLSVSWIFLGRKETYYYYYFPAAMVLSFTLTYMLHEVRTLNNRKIWRNMDWVFVLAVVLIFLFFYPVLSGEKFLDRFFERWIWMDTWI